MSKTPYDPSLITPSVYGDRRAIHGEIIALLHITFKERGLKLIQAKSRGLRRGEIHELMVTDEEGAIPGGGADQVSAIAFFEVNEGGLAVVDDAVFVSGKHIGYVAGFDLTHMPNHMNIVVKAESLDVGPLLLGDKLELKRLI